MRLKNAAIPLKANGKRQSQIDVVTPTPTTIDPMSSDGLKTKNPPHHQGKRTRGSTEIKKNRHDKWYWYTNEADYEPSIDAKVVPDRHGYGYADCLCDKKCCGSF